jgi:hypothetical protein
MTAPTAGCGLRAQPGRRPSSASSRPAGAAPSCRWCSSQVRPSSSTGARTGRSSAGAHQAAGGPYQAVAQPGVHRAGLSAADPRDAVRCADNQAFRVLGGVPQRGIFDNMKTAVDRIGSGKARQVNARFAAMASHYLFEPEFCNPASGWEKGQVEKNVQDARRRLWQPSPYAQLPRSRCAQRLARGAMHRAMGPDPAWQPARHVADVHAARLPA